ncbi:hypothetical protein [Homoserinibacter gongjuensis]|uniref:Uncharacterized protein n=1 Tax=Homoserinibacter gongjuensis TaxID=1162968 RepID=A0ABQ6JSF0_9MICO|nr:hypothetical protein GCM10025869_07630 [Homoserinibacter gongjuensis]
MVEEPAQRASRNHPHPTPAHRVGERVLRLADPSGAPLARRDVEVAQTRHAFAFGSTGFELIPHANGERGATGAFSTALADDWLGVFDTATLPFYRGDFEPQRGVTQTERIRTAARWFTQRGVRLKGHPSSGTRSRRRGWTSCRSTTPGRWCSIASGVRCRTSGDSSMPGTS